MVRRLRNVSNRFLLVLLLTASQLFKMGPALFSTANGETIFHIGERIPLKLAFTQAQQIWSTESINVAAVEEWEAVPVSRLVSPTVGWSDPLALYFAQGRIGCADMGRGRNPCSRPGP